MKTLKNLKKNNKGFTLIEIIIVIVIIAILAAMLIPSMISWIDKANQKTFLSACDSIETAINSQATEEYATTSTYGITDWAEVSKLVGEEVAASGATYNVTLPGDIATTKSLNGTIIANEKYHGKLTDGIWDVRLIDEDFPAAPTK